MSTEPPAPTPAPVSPQPFAVRAVGVALRLAMTAGILAGGWFLFIAYRSIFDDRVPIADQRPDPRAVGDLLPERADALVGAWVAGDDPWALGTRTVAGDRIDAAFGEPGRTALPGAPTELEAALLEWARVKLTRTERDGGAEFNGVIGRTRVRLVVGAGDRVRLAQAGWPDAAGWTIFELVPRASGGPPAGAPLAPLPPGATVAASRVTPDGRVIAQVVTGARPADLAATWAAAGWTVEPGPTGRSGGRSVRALALSPDDGPALSLLILNPTSTDGP